MHTCENRNRDLFDHDMSDVTKDFQRHQRMKPHYVDMEVYS